MDECEEYDDWEVLAFLGACALVMVPPVVLVFAAMITVALVMYSIKAA